MPADLNPFIHVTCDFLVCFPNGHSLWGLPNMKRRELLAACFIYFFTITAEILVRSLANFYRQYADRHMNLKFVRRVSKREREIRPFVIVKKQIDVSF